MNARADTLEPWRPGQLVHDPVETARILLEVKISRPPDFFRHYNRTILATIVAHENRLAEAFDCGR